MSFPVYIVENRNMLSEDGVLHTTYGIFCFQDGKIIDRIDDISTNQTGVERIAFIFNICHLNPQRFRSIIVEMISLGEDTLENIGVLDACCYKD